MSRRILALVIAAAVVTAGLAPATRPGPAEAVETPPPNILLILSDDQAVDDMRFMPFTRRLIGDSGATFTDAVAPYPLCCPARASLITGMFNHNNGVINNDPPYGGYQELRDGPYGDKTLPVWLKGTYQTSFVGKYLNGLGMDDPRELPAGWEHFAAAVKGIYDQYGQTVNVNGTLQDITGTYSAYFNQQQVQQRIRDAHGAGEPFFIWQSEVAPHNACWPTATGGCVVGPPMPAIEDRGTFATLPLATRELPSFNERVMSDKPSSINTLERFAATRTAWITDQYRKRIESLQAIDRGVRDTVALLGSLKRADGSSELDHTLIIYTSDNGYMSGQHRAMGKILPYEESLRVPMLMRGPGVPQGVEVSSTATLVDVAATIADAAGVTPMLVQDGQSLLPIAAGARPGWQALPIEAGVQRPSGPDQWLYRGVRTHRYVLVHYEQTDEWELYDRLRDPYQLNNVAYRPTYAGTRAALAEKLRVLRGCAGVACRSVSASGVPSPESDGTPVHPDELGSIGDATQVVTLTARTWRTGTGTAVAWQKSGRTWRVARGPFRVTLGANGLTRPGAARHLAGETPAGTFAAARAMGFRADPGGELRYRRLDANDHWSADPRHPGSYNVLQPRRSKRARWSLESAERFAVRRHRYPYALVVDHNLPTGLVRNRRFGEVVARRPADVRQGSFVVHAGRRVGRHGWVSMPATRLRWMLRWVQPSTRGTRFVVGTPDFLRSRL